MIISSLQNKKPRRAKQNKEFILDPRTPCPLLTMVIERNSRFKPRDTLSCSRRWWTFSGNDSKAGSSLDRARTWAHAKEKYCKKLEGRHREMYPTEKKTGWKCLADGKIFAAHGQQSMAWRAAIAITGRKERATVCVGKKQSLLGNGRSAVWRQAAQGLILHGNLHISWYMWCQAVQ